VVGLGEEGELDERGLAQTVKQGVIAWSQQVLESAQGAPASIELTATLAGSGGFGISAGASALAIVTGVQAANQALAEVQWPQVTQLTLIELFLDRANEAWRLLSHMQRSQPGRCMVEPAIASGTGARRRQEAGGYRGVGYELLRIAGLGQGGIEFAFGGRRARTEVYAERAQDQVVRELVGRAARMGAADSALGRTLFQLLVPVDLESQLASNRPMVLDLDRQTAPIPWELLEAAEDEGDAVQRRGSARPEPWAIRCKLLRKLRTTGFRIQVRDAHLDDWALVIGEPEVPKDWLPLPGARREAEEVAAQLSGHKDIGSERVKALVAGASAGEVFTEVLARRYQIVHISGHGQAIEDEQGKPQDGGVVLSGGIFLNAAAIKKMRTVPELVFVNCCHLAGRHSSHVLQDRAAFAATLAEELIDIGVRCVVAAGWEVGDQAALHFARAFYGALLDRKAFNDAVAAGRKAAWKIEPDGNTWGAYQCYGDPNWTLRRAAQDGNGPAPEATADDDIGSPVTLARVLEDVAAEHDSPRPGQDAQQREKDGANRLARVRALEGRFGEGAQHIGAVAEAFALVLKTLGRRAEAIVWYQKALTANDATASLKTAEHLYNLQARQAWDHAKALDTAEPRFETERHKLIDARNRLRTLASSEATQERWALVGSANKRLHQLELRAKRPEEARLALADAVQDYRRAEELAHERGDPAPFYPACNRMALELVAQLGQPKWPGLNRDRLRDAEASLQALHSRDPDFWTASSGIELRVYRAVSEGGLAEALKTVLADYEDVRRREPTKEKWDSIAAQAEFVLGRYGELAQGGEKKAAHELCLTLRRYANGA
jgi:tetratricopeptide (TPR) repeat protein